jgi:hypothetical protein
VSTAKRWLAKLNWKFGKKMNGIYINGHEQDDVVAYRDTFVNQWAEYKLCFHIWNNGDVDTTLVHPSFNPLSLILVTHDESIFF